MKLGHRWIAGDCILQITLKLCRARLKFHHERTLIVHRTGHKIFEMTLQAEEIEAESPCAAS
jgi:hypothetical protein